VGAACGQLPQHIVSHTRTHTCTPPHHTHGRQRVGRRQDRMCVGYTEGVSGTVRQPTIGALLAVWWHHSTRPSMRRPRGGLLAEHHHTTPTRAVHTFTAAAAALNRLLTAKPLHPPAVANNKGSVTPSPPSPPGPTANGAAWAAHMNINTLSRSTCAVSSTTVEVAGLSTYSYMRTSCLYVYMCTVAYMCTLSPPHMLLHSALVFA
jgi:hypothetical protein